MSLGQSAIKRAVDWITEELADGPKDALCNIIDRACREFDLTPRDAEFLIRNADNLFGKRKDK